MKRCAVTGATSMIGVALIEECIKNGTEVLAIIRKDTSRLSRLPQSELIRIEYADIGQLENICGDDKPYDVFYHFAWANAVKATRDDPFLQEENIKSALKAAELAKKLGCKKFIGAGSQAEYGIVDGMISSDTVPKPLTAYGMAKLSANLLSRRLCEQYGIMHIWGRIFSVYGCYDNEGTMLNYAIDQFIKGEAAKLSSATQMWNYLYESDAGKMFYLLGKNDVESGVYCIANETSRPLREYVEILKDAFGKNAVCEFAKDSGKKALGLQADIGSTIMATGFHPEVDFETGIKKVIEYKRAEYFK